MNEVIRVAALVFAALLVITGVLVILGGVGIGMIITGVLALVAATVILLWVRRSGRSADSTT